MPLQENETPTPEARAPRPDPMDLIRAVAGAATAPLPPAAALRAMLEAIGRHAGWLYGRVAAVNGPLINGESFVEWRDPAAPPGEMPPPDPAVAGRALAAGRPVPAARDDDPDTAVLFAGLPPAYRGYLAYPLQPAGGSRAVAEFYAAAPIRPGPDLDRALDLCAALLGNVVARGRDGFRLQESERRFHAVYDNSYQFIGLLAADGTLLEANETALTFGGIELEAVAGRKLWDTPWWSYSPAVRARLQSAVEQAAAGDFVRYETQVMGMGNRLVSIDFSIKPIRRRRGEIGLLIAEGRDISELRRTLEHLRLTEQRLEEAQRIAQIGHWDYDVATGRAVWSDTLFEIFGLAPASVRPTNEMFMDRIHPDDVESVRETLERSFRNRRPYEQNFRITRADGLVRTIYSAGRPILDDTGEVSRMTGIIQDITGRHQLEESLAKSVQQLSGLNRMGQTVASSLDLESIYHHVLSSARGLLKADIVLLFLHDGIHDLFVTAADQDGDLPLVGQRVPDNVGIAGDAWSSGQTIWVSGDQCRSRRSKRLAAAFGYDPGTIIAVPVLWKDEILGVLEAAAEFDDAFTLDDVKTLRAVATWTAIAIGNANQHRALERRLQESEAIAAVSRRLSETLEPQAILQMIVETAHNIVPRSDWAVIHLLRGRPERLDPVAVAGTADDLSDYVIAVDEGIAGLVLREGHAINVPDSTRDPRSSAYALSIGLHSLLVAPVQSRSRPLGTISLHCMEPGAFTDEDERLLTILAAQAGLALENAYLYDSQRRARLVAEVQRERLRVLADRIVTTQEEERLRISRELHDGAGQALTSLKISLDLLRNQVPPDRPDLDERLADLAGLTGETMDALRSLAHDLRPPGLDAFGLNVALEGLCHDFAARTGLDTRYEGVDLPGLPTTAALSMYRFVQEALTNIAKHADARAVTVALAGADGRLELSVADDGRGFDLEAEARERRPAAGIGLLSMQERVDLLGGSLEIRSAPGQGTRLTARVPLEAS